MAIINMPFEKNEHVYRRVEFNTLSLVEAKRTIPNVSYIEFVNACRQAYIPNFLIDLYYMHYLAILGDRLRARNFKLDLEQRNLDVVKLVNYNKEQRFNFGSVLHTCVSWNNDTTMIEFLKNECNGDFDVKDGGGFHVYSITCQEDVYTNPFLDILGYGERPVDVYTLFRRNPHDFAEMDTFLEILDPDVEEEEEEENIEVNEPQPLNQYRRNAVAENNIPRLQRQNAVVFDEEIVNNAPDYIPLPEFDDNWPEPHLEQDEPEPMEQDEPEPMEQDEPEPKKNEYIEERIKYMDEMDENKMNNKLVTIINNLFPNDNNLVEDIIGTLKAYEVFTVEEFIDSKLEEGDLEACGIEDEEVLNTIWDYIEKRSPNFVNGEWVN
jgi:hypothetical protein